MFADNSLWEGLSYTCQLSETVKWSGVIKFLTPINLIEPQIINKPPKGGFILLFRLYELYYI